MPATQPFTDAILQDSLARALQNVSRTLLRQEATLTAALEEPGPGSTPYFFQVIGNVGFAGDANGIVYLCMSDDFAMFAVSTVLGMSPAEVSLHGPEVLKDAIGEITNMTVGGFKNALCDLGFSCKLTLPTIVLGRNLTVAALKGTTRHRYRFTCAGHDLVADLQLKRE